MRLGTTLGSVGVAAVALLTGVTIATAQTATPTATATPTPTATATTTATATATATTTPTATAATATPTASATPAAGGFTGTAPGPGSIGLLVTSGEATAASLTAALAADDCTVQTLAVLENGKWLIYISGAPAVVNAQFPATLDDDTPFFIRCA